MQITEISSYVELMFCLWLVEASYCSTLVKYILCSNILASWSVLRYAPYLLGCFAKDKDYNDKALFSSVRTWYKICCNRYVTACWLYGEICMWIWQGSNSEVKPKYLDQCSISHKYCSKTFLEKIWIKRKMKTTQQQQ